MTDHAAIAALSQARDTLYDELTAMWRRTNGAPAIATYFTMREHYDTLTNDLQLALLGETPEPEPANLCPECLGIGYIVVLATDQPMGPFDPAEYDPEDCPVCGARGTLEEPFGEPVILDDYVAEWERGHA
jgi:hypothetical protein